MYRLIFVVFFAAISSVWAAPFKPATDAEVVERLAQRAGDATSRELTSLRAAVEKSPADPAASERLARRYFDLAMERGDPRYVGYMEAVVTRFPAPLPVELRLMKALVHQYRHGFDAALAELDAVLAADPELADAQAWKAAIFLVQAEYAAANTSCDALDKLGKKFLLAACRGLALAYGGQLERGYSVLQDGLSVATEPSNRLWMLTHLAEIAAWRGKNSVAEAHYRAALAVGKDDVYLLAAWTDFLLDAGRAAEVVTQLAGWEAADPLLLRVVEAHRQMKSAEADRLIKVLDERFDAARQRGDKTHLAEEARFQLRLKSNPQEALRLASENYLEQREPRDARILLEAALAAKDGVAAKPALDWLQRSGFEDVRLRGLGKDLAALR